MKVFKNDWQEVLGQEMEKAYFQDLRRLLYEEYQNFTIFPGEEAIYRALDLTSYQKTKVLILGQDPYHGYNQAEGLAFSVKEGVKKPPSLVNIYKELEDDLGLDLGEASGSLVPWAKEGVLLLNASLTVRQGQAGSHSKIGWEFFTDHIIASLDQKEDPMVFILWGAFARNKKKYLKNPKHLCIESAHPSPLSAYRGFFGSKPFSRTNDFLVSHKQAPINWASIRKE
ncbi:MAG: uracil-DNA glycosylase [Tissierellia bacterium]|nr:uracil-DNA glycosylase [Tissierellia bacterium]